MPQRTFYRLWCKKCKEYTLHYANKFLDKKDNGLKCQTCKTIYSDILLKDIPKEKLSAQRERYIKSQGSVLDYLNLFAPRNPLEGMFEEPGYDNEIIESDAGQKVIDLKIQNENAKKLVKQREEKETNRIEYDKYKHLGRNDKCICGSGAKYKKCCLKRIENLKYI